jgi:hypothetical protein
VALVSEPRYISSATAIRPAILLSVKIALVERRGDGARPCPWQMHANNFGSKPAFAPGRGGMMQINSAL